MPRQKSASGRKPSASMKAVPQSSGERAGQVLARPDGYYWRAARDSQEFGPFATREEALADMLVADDEAPAPGESLREAESELGIADWIDPETGEPAEGLSPPHLDGE